MLDFFRPSRQRQSRFIPERKRILGKIKVFSRKNVKSVQISVNAYYVFVPKSDNGRAYRSRRARRRAVCPEQPKPVLVVPPTQERTGRLKGWGKEKRGTITSPLRLCVTEPKPLILRKRFHPTPTSRKRKIILVEYKKEKFRLISALQALRVRRCVCFRR